MPGWSATAVAGNARVLDPKRQCRPVSWRALTRSPGPAPHHVPSCAHAPVAHLRGVPSLPPCVSQGIQRLIKGKAPHELGNQTSSSTTTSTVQPQCVIKCALQCVIRCALRPTPEELLPNTALHEGSSLCVRDAGSWCRAACENHPFLTTVSL